jgi:hypothetical protein
MQSEEQANPEKMRLKETKTRSDRFDLQVINSSNASRSFFENAINHTNGSNRLSADSSVGPLGNHMLLNLLNKTSALDLKNDHIMAN